MKVHVRRTDEKGIRLYDSFLTVMLSAFSHHVMMELSFWLPSKWKENMGKNYKEITSVI